MVGWHHRFDGHEFEQTLGIDNGQGSLVCYSPGVAGKQKRLHLEACHPSSLRTGPEPCLRIRKLLLVKTRSPGDFPPCRQTETVVEVRLPL